MLLMCTFIEHYALLVLVDGMFIVA